MAQKDTNPYPATLSRGRLLSREVRHFRLDYKDSDHWSAKNRSRLCMFLSRQGF